MTEDWMVVDWVLAAVALVVVTWTVLPLLRHEAWWIRAFDFPRVQIALLSGVSLVALLVGARPIGAGEAVIAIALGLCIVYQFIRIAPYTRLVGHQIRDAVDARPEDVVRLLIANVYMPNRRAGELLAMVANKDPDIVLAVETDRWWSEQLDGLAERYPYAVRQPLDNTYGMVLYSKLPLVEPEVAFLVEDDVPSVHTTVVLRSGRRVKLHCLHPAPPSPSENPTSSQRDAELVTVARAIDPERESVIVTGDLNDVAWSGTTRLFQKISGLLDPRIGRGMFNTFHAKLPFLRWPLDHIFCSRDFTVVALERMPAFGSDHFPMYAALCHTPEAGAAQEGPESDEDDEEEADDKLDDVDRQVKDVPHT